MLTKKEIRILKMLKSGMKQTKIAKKLKRTQPDISALKSNAYKKYRESHKVIKIFKEIGIKVEEYEL